MKIGLLARSLILLLASTLVVASPRAQEQSPSASAHDEALKSADATTASDDNDVIPAMAIPTANPYEGKIKQVGTGLPLMGTTATPLRWGDLSVAGFQYVGIHDTFQPPGTAPEVTDDLSILQMGLIFDRSLWRSRLVMQFAPQMAIVHGSINANVATNFTNSVGSTFVLAPRLSLTVQNAFTQVHSDQLVPERYLAFDAGFGGAVQNDFLNTNGNFVADLASADLEYYVSPRTTITVSPAYRYARTTDNTANYVANGQTYQGALTVAHALTPRRKFGFMETYQYLVSTAKPPSSARYFTSGLFYTEQLGRSFWVTGNVGAVHESHSELPGAAHWGISAGFSIMQEIANKVGWAIVYSRGVAFNNYVSTERSDRIDGSIGVHITSRIAWNNTIGYFREIGPNPYTNANYATTGIDYRFHGNLSFFSTYAYTNQTSNDPQLFAGVRRTLAWGLRWQPPRVVGK